MSEPFLAEIRIMGFNFAPRGWAKCDGQILPINQNQSLYSLLGTTYGGDGRTSFALPELRGRIPFHKGADMRLGQKSGEENHVLNVNEMPSHRHAVQGTRDTGNQRHPWKDPNERNLLARSAAGDLQYSGEPPNTDMGQTNATGGNVGHDNMPPFTVLNFCIALRGVFPSRN
jgi:microcystin-dependent protein